ncbi:MAG: glycoside hydrolase family 127 protein [Bacteroidales bacterium]|nr:glycoside hydrolase family 127 protein [Candidatus Cryptobacteroides caccocaballi]
MKTLGTIVNLTFAATVLASCSQASDIPVTDILEVPFTATEITDGFWAPRIETNRTVTIPAALYQCDINGRFDNFAIAGGLMEGEHRGDFSFDDTDPYKVIEGASYSLAAHYDPELDKRIDDYIAIIAAAQEPDGYLCTCVTNKCYRLSGWWGTHRWEKINSHELYNCGHLYEAAVAHYKATGKRTLLDVALKNADLVCETFGDEEGKIHRPGGHPIVEMGLAKLYKVTGDEKYLRQAKYFCDETGRCTDGHAPSMYSQDHMPIIEQEEIVGHAVRAGYLYSGVADVAALTHDKAYFDALSRIWDNMAGKKLYITGGIGSRAQGEGFGPEYELHNSQDYCETCASIANVYWNHRMFLYTGDSKYIDVLEMALYNGVMSGVSLDGDKFFYDNPLESMGEHAREEWFGCACCPGNITRFVASVPNYMYAVRGNDIYVNLFIDSHSDINTENGVLHVSQSTRYPWDGSVKIKLDPEQEGQFAVMVRVPGWAKEAPVDTGLYSFVDNKGGVKVSVNGGKDISGKLVDGYVVIDRKWKSGDEISVDFNMDVRKVQACDKVEDDRGKLAIMRGPVVYCLEGVDQENGHVFDKYIPAANEFTAEYKPELLCGVVELSGEAVKVDLDGNEEKVTVKAIPYSTWCNRGSDEMEVWIPVSAELTHPKPLPTIASQATAYTSSVAAIQNDAPESAAGMGDAWGVNDQWEPKSSHDISKPYHYWWQKRGSEVNLAYKFAKKETVSEVQVYWLSFDHYDGNYRVPESWKLYYQLPDGRWKEVEALDEYGVKEDCYNVVRFKPVSTDGLNIVAKLQEGESGGIIEWKVK